MRGESGGAAGLQRLEHPRSAAGDAGILDIRLTQRETGDLVRGELRVKVRFVLVLHPFGDVAVHVVQAPRIRLLLADRVVLVFAFDGTVAQMPGIVVDLGRIIAERKGGLGSGAAGVFPLRLRRQAVVQPRLRREPFAVPLGGVLSHADGGVSAVLPHAERHVGVRWRRLGDGIRHLVQRSGVDVLILAELAVHQQRPQFEFLPRHLVLAHPERLDLDLVLGAFVVGAFGFSLGAAHQEFAARNRHHVERDFGVGDLLRVRLHLRGGLRGRHAVRGENIRRTDGQSDAAQNHQPLKSQLMPA